MSEQRKEQLSFETSGRRIGRPENRESFVSPGLTMEGGIEGAGHVRIAGSFKGEVQLKGNETVVPGARITGDISAERVLVSGEVEGNICATFRVELSDSGVVTGDIKGASLIVAAGARICGKIECRRIEQKNSKVVSIDPVQSQK